VIQVAGYTIKQEIGVGGMATVYLAVQTSLEREVALKVMTPALVADPNFSRRFLMEARTLASLSHPNIVAVYDVGVTEQQLHYFSMQHLPGGDFAQRIKAGPPEPAEVARVLAGVARALGFAHLRGFVHRDVSPANILFDATDNPVLTDFGIARAVTRTSRLTNAGASVGTSHYMSPEQARGGNVDARSDLYSLGAVAFEALTGQPPFDGEDGFAIAYAHVFEPVPRLPARLATWQPLVDRALAKDPAERFPDSEAFIAALEDVGAGAGFSIGMPSLRSTGVHEALPRLDATPAAGKPTLAVPAPVAAPAAEASRAGSRLLLPAVAAIALGLAGLGIAAWMGTRGPAPATATPPAETIAAPRPAAPVPAPLSLAPPPVPQADPASSQPAVGEDAPPEDPEAAQRAIETGAQDPVASLLALGRADVAAQRLGNPPGRNALERYRLALRLAERFRAPADAARAREGLVATAAAYAELAERELADSDLPGFIDFSARAREIAASVPEGGELAAQLASRMAALRDEALAAARRAVEAWDAASAKAGFERALQFDPSSQDAQRGVRAAAGIGKPGFVFRDRIGDKARGPEMLVVASAGKRLAVARAEATLGEFRAFWSDGGSATRRDRPACRDRESFFRSSRTRSFENPDVEQGADHPVVCVSAADAEAYAAWLSQRTGKRYRLPDAAEWLALAGDAPAAAACKANLADAAYRGKYRDNDALACDDGFAGTAPVRRFDAPAGAVYDIAGNVREWVSDCAPGCRERTAMGSAWHSTADAADPRQREQFGADVSANTVGFRVVREID
jgi:hypothetical protein